MHIINYPLYQSFTSFRNKIPFRQSNQYDCFRDSSYCYAGNIRCIGSVIHFNFESAFGHKPMTQNRTFILLSFQWVLCAFWNEKRFPIDATTCARPQPGIVRRPTSSYAMGNISSLPSYGPFFFLLGFHLKCVRKWDQMAYTASIRTECSETECRSSD